MIEFACHSCNRKWETLSIDAHGIRLTDSEMRLCSKCGQRGQPTGTVI